MNTLRRYANLVRNIRTWPRYFGHKISGKRPLEFRFVTRAAGVEISIPAPLMGIFKEIFMNDVYRLRALGASLPAGAVVVDIGANIGLFSVAVLEFDPDAQIFAFEPLPANFQVLERNLQRPEAVAERIHLHRRAVVGSADAKEVVLYFDSDRGHTPVASVLGTFSDENRESLSVPACTLDDIVETNALPRIDVLKLDCEGAEYEILYGAQSATLSRVQRIAMETHDLDSDERCTEAMEQFLSGNGFEVQREALSEDTSMLWASRSEV